MDPWTVDLIFFTFILFPTKCIKNFILNVVEREDPLFTALQHNCNQLHSLLWSMMPITEKRNMHRAPKASFRRKREKVTILFAWLGMQAHAPLLFNFTACKPDKRCSLQSFKDVSTYFKVKKSVCNKDNFKYTWFMLLCHKWNYLNCDMKTTGGNVNIKC